MTNRLSGERIDREPIAIIGIGCRYPGGADSPDRFWQLLRDGVDAIDEIPAERLLGGAVSGDADDRNMKIGIRQGGFLRDIDRFDAEFFGISPREAEQMDPQQRLLLETAWEAVEDAGLARERLAGTRGGVYIGLWLNDYEASLYSAIDEVELHTTTGGGRYPAAGRLSFALDLRGPSLTVDTACSSSLVAVHLAVQALRSGETDLSLAGGVNVILQPQISIAYSRSGMLAPDERSKFGDARANGYVRSEGCGVVLLKRLSDALADGDPIHAVIRGSAINNDGQGSGLLVQPSVDGQMAMLRDAYADAGVTPGAVSYVEAHGTGTLAGDPVELQAIGAVLGEGRAAGDRCLVGSVKTNVGHTEGAAGVAGLIKAALALKHGAIPPSLHFKEPSPRIPWDALPVAIPTELTPMPAGDGPRYAGVSAFGITGTNAHIVLESAPARLEPADAAEPPSDAPVLLPLSAHSPSALRQLAGAYAGYLGAPDAPPIADVAFTAATRRSQLSERLAVVAGSHDEVVGRLTAFAEERPAAGISTGSANDRTPRMIFVFPGQGGQWLGMGLRLAATEPVFAASLARCSAAIEGEAGWSLVDELEAPEERSRLNEISVVQPAIFAIQVALADLLAHWGLRPDVVIGHSMGEIAAAHVAGILSLEDAAAVICRRSRLLKRVAGKGAMGVVELSLDEARELIAPFDGRLSVASSNGPTTTVLAGEEDALDEALQVVQERRGFARRVRVDVASHSPQVDPLLTELESALADLQPCPARIQFVSTVTGEPAAGPEMGSAYWARNLRQPVLFGPVVAELMRDGETAFLELSPHAVLLGAVESAARTAGAQAIAVGALRRDQDEAALLREAVGALWTAGIPVDWNRVTPGRVALPLPSYPWQRERFWFTSTDRANRRTGPVGDFAGPYLGARLPQLAHLPDSHFWQGHFQPATELAAVTVSGVPILPGAAAALVAHAAVAEVAGGAVQHLTLEDQPLLTAPVETQTIVTPAGDHSEIRVFTRVGDDEQWALWATAQSAPSPPPPEAIDIATLQNRLSRETSTRPGILECWQGGTEVLARIEPPADGEFRHAVVLDLAGQLLGDHDDVSNHLLAGADTVAFYAGLEEAVWAYANRHGDDPVGDVLLLAADGRLLAELRGARLRTPDDEFLRRAMAAQIEDWTYSFEWRPVQNPDGQSSVAGNWLILTDSDSLGSQLAASMERHGAGAHLIHESSDDAGTMTRLLREAVSADGPGLTGIIDLRALDVPGDDLPAAAERNWGSALALAQSLAGGAIGGTARLWLVTRGAQAASGAPDNPSAALLWGLGRVIANEHPEHWGGLIDLDPNPTNSEAELLCDAILLPDGEDEIALRGERRLVSRLTRGSGLGRNVVELHAGSTYLITGGTGGIGLIVARWMIESGARNLVLVGRRPPEEVSATLAELETSGARVTYLQGDVSSGDDVAAIFAAIACDCPPLRGIVHCAADTVDGTLLHQTQAGFNAVFGPKVTGAWNLASASRGLSLDFLALFSSIGALLGLPGLANYVAANTTVDALAQWLRASGVPATSIAWGHWHDVGLAARAGRRESFEHRGLVPMAPEAGIAALSRVLTMDTSHLAIVDVDWARYLAHTRTVAPRFTDLAAELADTAGGTATSAGPSLRERLEATNPAGRRDLLLENVRANAAAVLHLNDPQRVPPRQGFNQMGMDSLLAVELKNRLQQILGLSLPPTVAFDYPTPVALAQHLLDETFPPVPAAQPAGSIDDGVIDLPDLSREQLRDLMDAELQLIDKELG